MIHVHIRWMIRRDMPEVLQIEQDSFEYPWNEEEFLSCLRQRNVIGMVAEQGEKILGFMIYELHKEKLHLLNFAVHPGHRRAGTQVRGTDLVLGGVGTALVNRLKSKLSSHRRTAITLDVRESNLAAQLFFRSCGFAATQVLRRYYEDSGEDAYHLHFSIPLELGTPGVSYDEACEGV